MTTKKLDRSYYSIGQVAGVDEVGRGALAGPVVVTAIILKRSYNNKLITDSKLLTPKMREKLAAEILDNALAEATVAIDAAEIDQINILQATKKAMHQAILKLSIRPDVILVDAVDLELDNAVAIIKGDLLSFSIACASIVAKVKRDQMMSALDSIYPQYQFAKNKGYGTAEHLAALKQYGPCNIHRRTFGPVRESLLLTLF